ncbi:energy transducer TonB [Candidatus Omnitrophota bacterium]
MLADPVFKIVLMISLAAHIAVIVPMRFFYAPESRKVFQEVHLNYILIESPRLTYEEEVYDKEEGANLHDDPAMDDRNIKTEKAEKVLLSEEVRTTMKISKKPVSKKKKTVSSGESGTEETYLRYYNIIRERIRTRLRISKYRQEEGTLNVWFTVAADGRLVRINKIISDFSPDVKTAVIRAVRGAHPFLPFPEELGECPITFSLIIKFTSQ